MRFLVVGAAGMAGHVVAEHLRGKGHDVETVARSSAVVPATHVLDVRSFTELDRLLLDGRYDVVVNCVGLLIQACEGDPAEAALVNSYLPQHLARTLSGSSTRLIHLSTDCVFSGANGPYSETAPFDGQRVYDRSKALGEVRNDKDLTLRMSIIGPELSPSGTGLFHWFSQQSGTIQGYTRALWHGVTTLELALAVEALAVAPVTGLVHLVPPESVSKHALLEKLNQVFARGLTIEPVDAHAADKRLSQTRVDVPFQVQGYDAMLTEMREWISGHSALYPHYASLLDGDRSRLTTSSPS